MAEEKHSNQYLMNEARRRYGIIERLERIIDFIGTDSLSQSPFPKGKGLRREVQG